MPYQEKSRHQAINSTFAEDERDKQTDLKASRFQPYITGVDLLAVLIVLLLMLLRLL